MPMRLRPLPAACAPPWPPRLGRIPTDAPENEPCQRAAQACLPGPSWVRGSVLSAPARRPLAQGGARRPADHAGRGGGGGGGLSAPRRRAVVVERDSSEFARLSQLGDILGLSPLKMSSVHSQLAEQAYRAQAQQARAQALQARAGVSAPALHRGSPAAVPAGQPLAGRRDAPRAMSLVPRAGRW